MTKTKTTKAVSATAAGADHPERLIVPAALSCAASVYADRPHKLGEILIALAVPSRKVRLDDGQRVVFEMCRRELTAAAVRIEHQRERSRTNTAAWRERHRELSNKEQKQ